MSIPGRATGTGKYQEWVSPENLIIIEGMCRDGARDSDICEYIGISYTTFYKWISKYPEFAEAIKNGKEVVDRKVENALLKRCLGYDYVEVKKNKKGETVIREEKVKKYMPPDVTACAIWLNNRKPDEWKRNRDNYTISENDSGIQINIIKAKGKDEENGESEKESSKNNK